MIIRIIIAIILLHTFLILNIWFHLKPIPLTIISFLEYLSHKRCYWTPPASGYTICEKSPLSSALLSMNEMDYILVKKFLTSEESIISLLLIEAWP